jgi:protein-tyrosine phosphatase
MPRHLPLTSIENFRDFGGYDTRHGRPLKAGVLFRSAAHHEASEEDLALVAEIGAVHIVDLRAPHEREREPSKRWGAFAAEVIESEITHERDTAGWNAFMNGPMTPEWFLEDGCQFYRETPFTPRHIDLYSRYFRALAQSGGPVIVHCAAGKDRTGILCALTHHVAGVSRDDIFADYLLTNLEERMDRRAALFRDLVRRESGREIPAEAARIAVMAHAPYLETAFAEMEGQYGSIDGYLRDALGVDDALVEALEARLLD